MIGSGLAALLWCKEEGVFDDDDTAAFGFWKLEPQDALVNAGLNCSAAGHG